MSDDVILQIDERHLTDEDVAYLLLKKTGKTFSSFLLQTNNHAANVMQKVYELQKDGSLSKRQADFIADYIKGKLYGFSSENLKNILAFFEKTSPETVSTLAELPEIKQKISGKAAHPVEVLVADAIAASPLHAKVSLEIKKGLPYRYLQRSRWRLSEHFLVCFHWCVRMSMKSSAA